MSHFEAALEYVRSTLHELRTTGGCQPTASLAALQQFQAVLAAPRPQPTARPVAVAAAPALAAGKAERLAALQRELGARPEMAHLPAGAGPWKLGTGPLEAELLFIGEALEEAATPAGSAGELWGRILTAMLCPRESIYLAHLPVAEARLLPEAGLPHLRELVAMLQPRVVVALGPLALQALGGFATAALPELRGRWHDVGGTPLLVTFHPAALLQATEAEKRLAWEDMLLVLEKLARPVTARQRGYFRPRSGQALTMGEP